MISEIFFALVNGFASGMAVFLIAAGVTLIFGLLRILNFAHGSFFMLGAYISYTIIGQSVGSVWLFLFAALIAAAVVAALGLVTELAIFRRLRSYDEHYVLIATFALLMFVDGIIKLIWGLNYHTVSPPPELGAVIFIVISSVEISPEPVHDPELRLSCSCSYSKDNEHCRQETKK